MPAPISLREQLVFMEEYLARDQGFVAWYRAQGDAVLAAEFEARFVRYEQAIVATLARLVERNEALEAIRRP
jgi:hypothetical protein